MSIFIFTTCTWARFPFVKLFLQLGGKCLLEKLRDKFGARAKSVMERSESTFSADCGLSYIVLYTCEPYLVFCGVLFALFLISEARFAACAGEKINWPDKSYLATY